MPPSRDPTELVPVQAKRSWLHPATGALILGLDWLLFTSDVATAGASLLLTSLGGGLVAAVAALAIQKWWSRDSLGPALFKALVAAACVGAPTPIGGTFVGALVLGLSGLSHLRGRREGTALSQR